MLTLRDYLVQDLKVPQLHFWLCNRLNNCGWWMTYFKLACLCFICELLLSNYDCKRLLNVSGRTRLSLRFASAFNCEYRANDWSVLDKTEWIKERNKDRNCVWNSKTAKTSRFWSLKSWERTRFIPAGRLAIVLKPLITLVLKPTKSIRGNTTGI